MMFEMKLGRCFITSTLEFLVIYYLIRSVSVTILSTFWTNERLFCENRGRSLFRVEDQEGPGRPCPSSSLARASRLHKRASQIYVATVQLHSKSHIFDQNPRHRFEVSLKNSHPSESTF